MFVAVWRRRADRRMRERCLWLRVEVAGQQCGPVLHGHDQPDAEVARQVGLHAALHAGQVARVREAARHGQRHAVEP